MQQGVGIDTGMAANEELSVDATLLKFFSVAVPGNALEFTSYSIFGLMPHTYYTTMAPFVSSLVTIKTFGGHDRQGGQPPSRPRCRGL